MSETEDKTMLLQIDEGQVNDIITGLLGIAIRSSDQERRLGLITAVDYIITGMSEIDMILQEPVAVLRAEIHQAQVVH